jgi:hypothetical protein
MTVVRTPAARSRRVRTPLADITKLSLEFLTAWGTAKDAGTLRDKARDGIKAWFARGGDAEHEVTVNDNGSQLLEFPEVVEIGGRKFAGVENRRTVTSVLDPDLIDEWLESLPSAKRQKISAQILTQVTEYVLDPDALFKLNQEGVIDDDTLDGFYRSDVKWSLNAVLA